MTTGTLRAPKESSNERLSLIPATLRAITNTRTCSYYWEGSVNHLPRVRSFWNSIRFPSRP